MGRPRKRARRDHDSPLESYEVVPTQEQWESMKTYGSFTIMDRDQLPNVFYTGDHIFVMPLLGDGKLDNDLTMEEMWVAKIDSIHAQSPNNAWMRVQWYYHPNELKQQVPSFQFQFCGKQERILSTHYDIIPTISCNGKAEITKIQDDDPSQDVAEDDFYYRVTFERDTLKRKGKAWVPVTPFALSCTCKMAYGPLLHIMHWCSKCKRWFHKDCLVSAGQSPARAEISPLSILEKGDAKGGRMSKNFKEQFAKVELVAQYPIVRGLQYGIVGNFHHVSEARQLHQKLLNEGSSFKLPADWEDSIGLSDGIDLDSSEPWCLCPVCENFI